MPGHGFHRGSRERSPVDPDKLFRAEDTGYLEHDPHQGFCTSELWKDVINSGGWYEVSTCGRVRSWKPWGKKDLWLHEARRLLTPTLLTGSSNGLRVLLDERWISRARLVLESFRGVYLDMIVQFRDKDCHNCHYTNLIWRKPKVVPWRAVPMAQRSREEAQDLAVLLAYQYSCDGKNIGELCSEHGLTKYEVKNIV